MGKTRALHPDFLFLLGLKDKALVQLFQDLRTSILDHCPEANELLYHTHALTAVFSLSDKLSDAFCMIPVYTAHLNLGFNKGTLLHDPHRLLQGTGNLIRHIPVAVPGDYRNDRVGDLIGAAIEQAFNDLKKPPVITGQTISKLKKK